MIKFIAIAIIGFILNGEWQTYTDRANGFSMKYPKEWSFQEKNSTISFVSPKENDDDIVQEKVNVMVQDLSQEPMNLEQFTELSKRQIKEYFTSYEILSIKNGLIAGYKSIEMIYTCYVKGKDVKLMQRSFIMGNTAFVFTYMAEASQYDKYEGLALETIDSFKFTK